MVGHNICIKMVLMIGHNICYEQKNMEIYPKIVLVTLFFSGALMISATEAS